MSLLLVAEVGAVEDISSCPAPWHSLGHRRVVAAAAGGGGRVPAGGALWCLLSRYVVTLRTRT